MMFTLFCECRGKRRHHWQDLHMQMVNHTCVHTFPYPEAGTVTSQLQSHSTRAEQLNSSSTVRTVSSLLEYYLYSITSNLMGCNSLIKLYRCQQWVLIEYRFMHSHVDRHCIKAPMCGWCMVARSITTIILRQKRGLHPLQD